MLQVVLKPGREKTLQRRHPWLFSGAILHADKNIQPGETVRIISQKGETLALGAYSPHSQIRIRVWTFDPAERIDKYFFRHRLEQAYTLRRDLISTIDTAMRLVNSESDGLPGLIVDRYSDFLVCQFLSAGVEFYKQEILDQLEIVFEPAGIYERSDTEVRNKEGLKPCTGLLRGIEPPEVIRVEQDGIRLLVDIRHGHKTGAYLDQCDNRKIVERYSKHAEVLNCFAYTGGFTLAALRGGASKVINLELSADAIAMLIKNVELNGYDTARLENIQGDVFDVLRQFRDTGKRFDLIILDPPKFIHSAQHLQKGCRGYKDINLLAMKLLKERGILITFSCSGLLPAGLFQKIVADAAMDAGRHAKVINVLGQSVDHPVALNFPEGGYLKGLVCYLL
jgi:Predicted SAM-dependent methyltransferases